jgi:MarR family 2-MHQ and catechol resistance regulon transcriptional repressor
MAVFFTHLSGTHRGQVDRFPEPVERLSIGRALDCQVRVSPADTVVSSHHAQVLRTPRGYVLEDVGSRNGTFVNGQAVERAPIVHGDRVQLGPGGPELRFEQVSDDVRAHAEEDLAVLVALLDASDAVNKYMASYLGELGLTSTKFSTLQVLSDDLDHGVTQNQLGSRLTVTGANITGVIDRLERDHLVSRETHPTDRRANLVRLTGEGQSVFQQAADLHAMRTHDLIAALEGPERAELARLLRKLAATAKEKL